MMALSLVKQSVQNSGLTARLRRWAFCACTITAFFVHVGIGDLQAAPEAAASQSADRGPSATAGDGPGTQVAQDLATCQSAIEVERPTASALATCRGVATAPWETNHTRVDAYIALGRALGRLGRFAEALDAAYAAKSLNTEHAGLRLFEAWAY